KLDTDEVTPSRAVGPPLYVSPSVQRQALLRAHNPGSFPNDQELVAGNVLELVHDAARPPDFQPVQSARLAQADVYPQIVLGKIAPAAADLVNLTTPAGKNRDPSANTVPIGLGAHGADREPMVLVSSVVAQQGKRIILIVDDDVQIAIVVKVAERYAAS